MHRPRSDHDGATPHSTGLAVLGLLRVRRSRGPRRPAPDRGARDRDARLRCSSARRTPSRRSRAPRSRRERGLCVAVIVGAPRAIRRRARSPRARAACSAPRTRSSSSRPARPRRPASPPSWLAGREPQGGRPTAWICRGVTLLAADRRRPTRSLRRPPRCASVRASDVPGGRPWPAMTPATASGHDDGLTPLTALDPAATQTVDELVRAMCHTAFGGRRLGEAADVLEAMVRDPDCYRVLTISGAMTIAKQGLLRLRDDRPRLGAGDRHDRRADDPRPLRGRGHAALQAPRVDARRGALREGLQPRLRHDRARAEPRRRREDPRAGARCAARRQRALEPPDHRAPRALPRAARAGARDPEERLPEAACRSSCRPSPTRSSGSTSRSTT